MPRDRHRRRGQPARRGERARASRCCSSTSSPAITAAGSRRSGTSPARYRCVTYAARGYLPSGVPADPAAYSQERAVADAIAVLDGLGIRPAHVVGLSMGGFAALHLTLRHPDRVLSTVVAGAGYGAGPERQAAFRAECEAIAAAFANEGAGEGRRAVRGRPGPGAVPEQEPARLGRVRGGAGRALGAGRRADHARRPGRPAVAVRADATNWPGSPRRCWCWRATRTRAAWTRR